MYNIYENCSQERDRLNEIYKCGGWRAGELHYVRTIENCTLPRPRNVVLVFPNNAINYVDVEVIAAGACVCQQTENRDAADYCVPISVPLYSDAILNHRFKKNIDKKNFNSNYYNFFTLDLLNSCLIMLDILIIGIILSLSLSPFFFIPLSLFLLSFFSSLFFSLF